MKKTMLITLSIMAVLALAIAFYAPGALAASKASSQTRTAITSASTSTEDNVSRQSSASQVETEKHNGKDDAQPTLEATPEAGETEMETEGNDDNSKVSELEDEAEFSGAVQSMGADSWVVGGKTVQVSLATEIKGIIAVGDQVKIEGAANADGTFSAREITKADVSFDSGGDKGSSDDMSAPSSPSNSTTGVEDRSGKSGRSGGSDDGSGHN